MTNFKYVTNGIISENRGKKISVVLESSNLKGEYHTDAKFILVEFKAGIKYNIDVPWESLLSLE